MPNDNKVWQAYLKQLGYTKEKMPKKLNNKRYTLEEFINEIAHKNFTYIISIAKHLTVVKDKKLYDTWNCEDYIIRKISQTFVKIFFKNS